MAKIESPVKRWPGTVTLPDYLNWPQYLAWRDGVRAAREVLNRNKPGDAGPETQWTYDEDEYRHAFMGGVCGVVLEWNLSGLPSTMTPDTFPTRPYRSANNLFLWLTSEISKIVEDATNDDPK